MIHKVGDTLQRRGIGRKVYVDNVEVAMCFYADVERGFARYNVHDSEGYARKNRRGTGVRWAKKRGKVEVYRLMDPKPTLSAPDYFQYMEARSGR